MMVIRTTMDVSVLAAGRGSRPRKMMPAIEDLYSRYADRTWAEQWCGRGDLNPHAFWAPPPQDGVSANFTTSALQKVYFFQSLTRTSSSRRHVDCMRSCTHLLHPHLHRLCRFLLAIDPAERPAD